MALRGRVGTKPDAHAYMHAKGVPQLLDSVLKQLLVEQPDDAVGFMRELLRKASEELEGGAQEESITTARGEAGVASPVPWERAHTPTKSADTLRMHAEFTDASGASTQTHMLRVSASGCGRVKLLAWCEEAHEALKELAGVAGVGPRGAASGSADGAASGPSSAGSTLTCDLSRPCTPGSPLMEDAAGAHLTAQGQHLAEVSAHGSSSDVKSMKDPSGEQWPSRKSATGEKSAETLLVHAESTDANDVSAVTKPRCQVRDLGAMVQAFGCTLYKQASK